jgi:hypothetical protein
MKVNVYYVVKDYKPGYDSVGRYSDAVLVSGPWPNEEVARTVMNQMENPYDYKVVVDELKVKLA